MRFSPLLLSALIVKPLRYFFTNYSVPGLNYNSDETLTDLEIDVVNNFHKVAIQAKPRILIDRGAYQVGHVGLTDNLAQGKSMYETLGLTDQIKMVLISGQAMIRVEARQEGVVESLADMVSHFLVWTKPYICDSQGFKDFATPLTVSAPTVAKEDDEFFTTMITVPWSMEEQWHVKNDALKLNQFFITFNTLED